MKTLRLSELQISESSIFYFFLFFHSIPCALLGYKSEKVIWRLFLKYFIKIAKCSITKFVDKRAVKLV